MSGPDDARLGELTDDAICGEWRIWQRRRGHRYSLDDLATAWEAVSARPGARRYCDLGSGIGSVLLMVSYKLAPSCAKAAVEAQAISFELLRRNVARNGLTAALWHGDLRDPELAAHVGAGFDLVTGTPPYVPPGKGSPSTDEQRTYARIEMRGGVEDYLAAASRILADDGALVVCCDARTPERAIEGGVKANLHARRRRDVVPRAGRKGALFSVWTFVKQPCELVIEPALVARDEGGGRTETAHALRRFFDLPVDEDEPASPGLERRPRGR
ncbi:MAG: SAM-dependent methyltransferase [Sandaracinaceae bacterium]|nr:SAM-dependent methyltransferase [Sandaracinaceae bacterium]